MRVMLVPPCVQRAHFPETLCAIGLQACRSPDARGPGRRGFPFYEPRRQSARALPRNPRSRRWFRSTILLSICSFAPRDDSVPQQAGCLRYVGQVHNLRPIGGALWARPTAANFRHCLRLAAMRGRLAGLPSGSGPSRSALPPHVRATPPVWRPAQFLRNKNRRQDRRRYRVPRDAYVRIVFRSYERHAVHS
jgi:hypothetical protein